jgi:signal transduction histidine kinase
VVLALQSDLRAMPQDSGRLNGHAAEPATAGALVRTGDPLGGGAVARTKAALRHRERQLHQEIAVRIGVSAIVLVCTALFALEREVTSVIRITALIGLVVNLPYVIAARRGRARREQAYIRLLVDVALTTAGLYGAGGLAAAPFIGIYAVAPVFAAIVFSRAACILAVAFATGSYLALAGLQTLGVVPFLAPPAPDAWHVAIFNLLVLNAIGWLAAVAADAHRTSRRRLAALYDELERAHDQSLQLNNQLQLSTRRYVLSEVVAGVTYEVRDALQGAFGHLWLARRGGPPLPPPALEHLARVEQACQDAMRIMSNTLDMARRADPEPEPVAVAEVIRRVAQMKAVEVRRERITLRQDLPDWLPVVLGNAFALQQLLLHVVTNAQDELRGSAGRREISIGARAEAERVVIDVRDTGRGIPAQVLPRVFEPFYTTRPSAAGLGLALAAGIANSLGGTLTAENHREGGALIRLTLPAVMPAGATRPSAASGADGA